jgi:fido (protein-threonine AMPylation protein)
VSDDDQRAAEQEARSAERAVREQREADLVRLRIGELRESPIQGNFDVEHLKAVHAQIFQDLPHHEPGIIRDDTHDSWTKNRVLEGQSSGYAVHYAYENVEKRIDGILTEFGGSDTLEGLTPDEAASRMAKLYGDLDHAHGFYEGNSRTLREFTRELAEDAGYALDWVKTGIGTKERNELYIARDVAVLERAFPDLTPERAMKTNDLVEYEASFVLTGLRRAKGDKSLETIIRGGLTQQRTMEQDRQPTAGQVTRDTAKAGFRVVDAATGAVEMLGSFIDRLLGGKPSAPSNDAQQMRANRGAYAALGHIAACIERGKDLSASDIAALTPTDLENIKLRGDAYVLDLIEMLERDRQRERDGGRTR